MVFDTVHSSSLKYAAALVCDTVPTSFNGDTYKCATALIPTMVIPWLLFAPWRKPFTCSVPYISIVGAAVVARVHEFSHFLKKFALRFDQLFAVKVAVIVVFVEVVAVVVRSRLSSSL